MQTHIVAKTIVFDEGGQLLVLWRSADDAHRPGGFDFPGGKVDDGESVPAGAARELLEEAGLSLDESALQLVFATTKIGYQTDLKTDVNFVWLGFIGHLPQGQAVKLSHEHQRFEWLSLEAALAICDSPTQKVFLMQLRDHNLIKGLTD
jgi:8-oxo-dGTP pyrophosphatase MutT (NUDIX family)